MESYKNKYSLIIVAIVAIVAIVGIILITNNVKKVSDLNDEKEISINSDIVGEASRSVKKSSTTEDEIKKQLDAACEVLSIQMQIFGCLGNKPLIPQFCDALSKQSEILKCK